MCPGPSRHQLGRASLQLASGGPCLGGLGLAGGPRGDLPVPQGARQLFARGCLFTAATTTVDDAYRHQAAPRSAFLPGSRGDALALCTWATPSAGAITAKGMQFAAWVHMAPTTHTSCVREFHRVYCSAPCFGWGDHMARDCVVVVALALPRIGVRSCTQVVQSVVDGHHGCPRVRPRCRGLAVACRAGHRCSCPGRVRGMGLGSDLVGATIVTLPITCRVGLTAAYLHAAGEWASLLPAP